MNKEHMKSAVEKAKGKFNEAVGRATDNPEQELKGVEQQRAGEGHEIIGDIEDAAKDLRKAH
ncbi:CsbD family protein [Paraburkholderia tropica]|uniref:CsbD-like protein n=1 Tax=Paraburkholderia tropica TaxID=92647 RepID=A0ABX5MH40_9BURK|nr:CsbD family protein [Paraburkholderia tropica]PXX07070.1 CsbD-like protein [Paraburkholderia tropica]PZW72507.1 CsbD-like protein [Paraburkholderia tropica]